VPSTCGAGLSRCCSKPGHPWITFPRILAHPFAPACTAGVGTLPTCGTEITLNTSNDVSRGLQSPAAVKPYRNQAVRGLGWTCAAESETIPRPAMRMSGRNVLDVNFYRPFREARRSNLRHRPVGLGVMGYQDALYTLRLPVASERRSASPMRAWKPSASLPSTRPVALAARTRAVFLLRRLAVEPGHPAPIDFQSRSWSRRAEASMSTGSATLDWESLARPREERRHAQLLRHGDCTDGDHLQHLRRRPIDRAGLPELYVKANMSGDFTSRVNPRSVRDLKGARVVGHGDGERPQIFRRSLGAIDRVPDDPQRPL